MTRKDPLEKEEPVSPRAAEAPRSLSAPRGSPAGSSAEPPDDLALAVDQPLLEVPPDVVGRALGVGDTSALEDWVRSGAVDVDLLRHGEGDAVGRRAELGDLLRVPGSCPSNWLHGTPTTVSPGRRTPPAALEARVLRGEPAPAATLTTSAAPPPEVAQRRRLALQSGHGDVEEVAHFSGSAGRRVHSGRRPSSGRRLPAVPVLLDPPLRPDARTPASCGRSRRLRLSSAKPGNPASATTWSQSSPASASRAGG